MNPHIVLGLFALYVAAVSLYLVLSGRHDALLALLRRFWGRSLGHTLYFLSRIAMPMLVFILCLGWGVSHFKASVAALDSDSPLQLNVEYYRELKLKMQGQQLLDPTDIIFGA